MEMTLNSMWLLNKENRRIDKQVKQCLQKTKCAIKYINTDFEDLSSHDFPLEKDVWNNLPDNLGKGVKLMGLSLTEEYRSLLISFPPNSSIEQHYHANEHEYIFVLEGKIYDEVNNVVKRRGESYTILKGVPHHITTKEEPAYMFMIFSENKDDLRIHHKDYEKLEQFDIKPNGK